MKKLLATVSVVALIALPGCCKKKETPVKQETTVKTERTVKTVPVTKKSYDKKKECSSCKTSPKKGCKACSDSSKYSYLELQEADDLLS